MANILFPNLNQDEMTLNASVSIGEDILVDGENNAVVQVSLNDTGDGTSFRKSNAEKLSRALAMQAATSERLKTPVEAVEVPGKAVVDAPKKKAKPEPQPSE